MFRFSAFGALLILIALNAHAADASFTRSLKLGMSGSDVRVLQMALNASSDTQIAVTGPGSPGNETTYFGSLTQKAVIKFQEKYRNEILVPNGLSAGTGFVGPSSIAVLSHIRKAAVASASAPKPPSTGTSPTTLASPKAPVNPNLARLDVTLAAIDDLGAKQGFSKERLTLIKSQITKDVTATTTDLTLAFVQAVINHPPPVKTSFEFFLDELSVIATQLVPKTAFAFSLDSGQLDGVTPFDDPSLGTSNILGAGGAPSACSSTPGLPFGGAIVGVPYWCMCTDTYLITITPLPPLYPKLLTYKLGTQQCLKFNIPATLWMLGNYEPVPICLIFTGDDCIPTPADGHILPTVGSS